MHFGRISIAHFIEIILSQFQLWLYGQTHLKEGQNIIKAWIQIGFLGKIIRQMM